jgi:hypothetical protein
MYIVRMPWWFILITILFFLSNRINNFFKVNRRLGLSPGYFTQRLARIRDIQHKKRKAIASTFKAKQKRRALKSKR